MLNTIPGVKPRKLGDCLWCGKPVSWPAAKECERCWELRVRIQADLQLAKDMIEFIEINKGLEGE